MNIQPLDLSQEPPRSPHTRLGNYVILARAIDKGRASQVGQAGDYHFDCPLDNMLFSFKGVTGADLKQVIASGATDEELVTWLDAHGTPRSPEEIAKWSDGMDQVNPTQDPEKRVWFAEQLAPLGLDPATTTLFQWLDEDDRASYAAA